VTSEEQQRLEAIKTSRTLPGLHIDTRDIGFLLELVARLDPLDAFKRALWQAIVVEGEGVSDHICRSILQQLGMDAEDAWTFLRQVGTAVREQEEHWPEPAPAYPAPAQEQQP
jgi:hypothetical protein